MEWTKYLWDPEKLEHPSPASYEIDLTNVCNLNCSFCSSRDARERKPIHAEFSKVKWIIHDAIEKNIGVSFTGGGEPTLYPQFSDAIKEALPCVGLGFVSNGTNPDKIHEYLEITKDHKNSWVRLSLNDRPINDGLRKLFADYPGRIGISIVAEDIARIYPAEELIPLAKLVRKKVPNSIVPVKMTPQECVGRKFVKVWEPDGTIAWCCQARGMKSSPPKHCIEGCRWVVVDLKKAWEANPFT